MAKNELSAGYKVLAQALVYDFKDPDGTLKNGKWTPHNIKTLVLVLGRGFLIKGYSSAVPVTKSANGFVKFEGQQKEDYADILTALFRLENGMSAVVANVREIIVVMGAAGTAPIFNDAREFMTISGYDNPNAKQTVVSYANQKATFDCPVLTFIESEDIFKAYYGSQTALSAKVAIVKNMLAQTPLNIKDVKLQERDGDDIGWDVIPDSKYIQRNPRQSIFPLDDTQTAFCKLSNLILDSDVLKRYGQKLGIKFHGSFNMPEESYDIKHFTVNRGNYPADDALRKYMHDNYFKPLAVFKYLLGAQDSISSSDTDKLHKQLEKANELLNALRSAANTESAKQSLWAAKVDISTLRYICSLVANDYKLELTPDMKSLLDSLTMGTIDARMSKLPAAVFKSLVNTYVSSVVFLAQVVLILDLFKYGFSTDSAAMANNFYGTVNDLLGAFVHAPIYVTDQVKTASLVRIIGGFAVEEDSAIRNTVRRLINDCSKFNQYNPDDVSLTKLIDGYILVANDMLAQGI